MDLKEFHRRSIEDREAFWAEQATLIDWHAPFTKVLDWTNAPFAKWFVGGKLNASAVCLDQHVVGPRAQKRAIVWEGEPGDTRTLTYAELHLEVCRFANVLKARGVKRGDRVAIYMPMIPEAAIAMLACARIGAAHSVVFGGFAAHALRERILDGGCTAVITADGSFRRRMTGPVRSCLHQERMMVPPSSLQNHCRRPFLVPERLHWRDGSPYCASSCM